MSKRRRRPGKHTVHTKDSRYNVKNYPRGDGPLVTRHGVTKTQHAWDVDDGMVASPVYDKPTDEWRGDHNRSDVRNVDYPDRIGTTQKYSDELKSLKKLKKQARTSPDLKEAINETIKALERGDVELAYELTAVKSLIVGDIKYDPKRKDHFREDDDYNQKKFGYSVYRELDGIHHDLAMDINRMPSGTVLVTSEGIIKGKRSTRKHRTISLMNKEHKAIRERLA